VSELEPGPAVSELEPRLASPELEPWLASPELEPWLASPELKPWPPVSELKPETWPIRLRGVKSDRGRSAAPARPPSLQFRHSSAARRAC
jgi:hypothetical protein